MTKKPTTKRAKRTAAPVALNRQASAFDRHLGQIIVGQRNDVRMTQEQLADVLGCTFQQVQKYEKGANRITVARLFDIVRALKRHATYNATEPTPAQIGGLCGYMIGEAHARAMKDE